MPKQKIDPIVCKIPKGEEERALTADDLDSSESGTWRIFRIMAEFVSGFHFISRFTKSVTFFGSGRLREDDKYYQEARALGRALGEANYNVITGGGAGIMEAGNRGAFEAGCADSIGINIQLPYVQRMNKYVTRGQGFHYFFTRKVMMSAVSQAYVYFPGGFGTLDEFFEIITLIQTRKMESIPVILYGSDFWRPFTDWIEASLLEKFQTIHQEDCRIYTVVDSVAEAMKIIKKSKPRRSF